MKLRLASSVLIFAQLCLTMAARCHDASSSRQSRIADTTSARELRPGEVDSITLEKRPGGWDYTRYVIVLTSDGRLSVFGNPRSPAPPPSSDSRTHIKQFQEILALLDASFAHSGDTTADADKFKECVTDVAPRVVTLHQSGTTRSFTDSGCGMPESAHVAERALVEAVWPPVHNHSVVTR